MPRVSHDRIYNRHDGSKAIFELEPDAPAELGMSRSLEEDLEYVLQQGLGDGVLCRIEGVEVLVAGGHLRLG